MRKLVIFYLFVCCCTLTLLTACNKKEDIFSSYTGNIDPASIESSSFQMYLPLENTAYTTMYAKGLGIDSVNIAATGGKFVSGARGYAFSADTFKKAFIKVPLKSSAFIKKLNEFTMSFWVNVPDTNTKQISSLFMADDGSNPFGSLSVTLDSVYLNGCIYNASVDSTYKLSVPKRMLKANTWSHVVFTYDLTTSKMSLYIDGKISNEAVCQTKQPAPAPMGSLTLSSAMSVVYLGAWVQQIKGTATPQMVYFPGKIDEIRIWSKCLTAEEVSALAQAESVLANIQL